MSSLRFRRPKVVPRTGRAFPGLEVLESRNLLSVSVGIARAGLGYTGYIPPDTIGAVGPNHYVEALNLTMGVYAKGTGNLLSSRSFASFFSPLGGIQNQSDPFVTYDTFTDQFVVGVIDYNSLDSRLDLAVSTTSDPTGSWTFRRYDMTHDTTSGTYLSDYPRFGYNADAYVVTFNMFPNPSGSQHVDTLSIRKSDLAGFVYAWPTGTVQIPGMSPSVMHDAAAGGPMWLVGTGGFSNIRVYKMTNEFSGTPTITPYSVGVPSYGAITAPRQPGGSMSWNFDTRIFNAAMRGGMLVAAHAVRSGTADVARWYELDTTGASPTLAQEGQVNPAGTTDTYFPTIDINAAGSLGMTYIESSPTEFMSMWVTGRTTADPAGTMQAPAVVFQGNSNYTIPRAGDYSGISVDPSNGSTFWAANEYKASSNWNTGFASFDVNSVNSVTHFSAVPLTNPVTAGTAFSVTVTALDASNNVVPGYRGTVHFTSTDPQVTSGNGLPSDYAFTAADNGVHTFGVTLLTAGGQTATVTDTVTGTITGSAAVTVLPGQAAVFAVATTAANPDVAGTPFDVTVTVQDPYGNTVTGYTGTVHFSSADPYGATLPADYPFQPADAGVHTFAGGATLYTAGTWDVTATDTAGGISGSASVNVMAAPAVAFQVGAPAAATAGVAFDFTVTAVDPYGNTDTTYAGTVGFSTQDPAGTFNPNGYTFQPGDMGAATFPQGATLNTAGNTWDVTATDATSGITGSANVTVTGAAPAPPGNPPPSARPWSADARALAPEGAVSRGGLLSDPAALGRSSTGAPGALPGWHAPGRAAGGAWALDVALWELARERNGA
jgi:hypothetical protein